MLVIYLYVLFFRPFSNYIAKYTKLTFVIPFNLSFKLNYVIKTDVKSAENRKKIYVKPTNNTNTPKTDRCRKLGGQGYMICQSVLMHKTFHS